MVNSKLTKVAVACQGGGMHAAFEVGVLTEILETLKDPQKKKFELVGLSGTSAGALCALMVWYGLAPKNGKPGSALDAATTLNRFWDDFVASTGAENLLNLFTFGAFSAEEIEIPVFGLSARVFGLNPREAFLNTVTAFLPRLGVRKQYFDLDDMLARACPEFAGIDWPGLKTRLLIGASEVVNGFETVFDSDVNKDMKRLNKGMHNKEKYWHQQLPLTLSGVAASGTLPLFREAEHIPGAGYYWDGLYSQNPPVREFLSRVPKDEKPDELWIVRINPQQWPEPPKTNADVMDRENELMGNLSLNKELDFILKVNKWLKHQAGKKPVTVRTIKMTKKTADDLRYSSKFDRSRTFMDQLRKEGQEVAQEWLAKWPNVHQYPDDAAYP